MDVPQFLFKKGGRGGFYIVAYSFQSEHIYEKSFMHNSSNHVV